MHRYFILSLLFFIAGKAHPQQTVGLFTHETGQLDGYVLFSPIPSTNSYLIDKCGKLVHTWPSTYRPGQALYLLEDGSLLRTGNTNNPVLNGGGTGGVIEKIDWDGNITWSYTISTATECQHHDIFPMPNGNILVVAWQVITYAETVADGRAPSVTQTDVWSEKIIELQPVGNNSANIVWEWHAWDHLVQDYDASKNNYGVVADHPELIDVNYEANALIADWLHFNSVDYNPALDKIVISIHNFDEIWIIDHSTTTAEAASHSGGNSGKGGDLLYRWGNPDAYGRGIPADKKLFAQHDANWITPGFPDENKIMIFNNGLGRPQGNYSTVEIIDPPIQPDNSYAISSGQAYLPTTSSWTYTAPTPTDFFSPNISGARRLSNGNTMVCEGAQGRFFELDINEGIVWEYINPVRLTGPVSQGTSAGNNAVFRCTHYEPDFAGFTGRDLTPGSPVELNPLPYTCDMITGIDNEDMNNSSNIFPNPAGRVLYFNLPELTTVSIYNLSGQLLVEKAIKKDEATLNLEHLAAGTYIVKLYNGQDYVVEKLIKE